MSKLNIGNCSKCGKSLTGHPCDCDWPPFKDNKDQKEYEKYLSEKERADHLNHYATGPEAILKAEKALNSPELAVLEVGKSYLVYYNNDGAEEVIRLNCLKETKMCYSVSSGEDRDFGKCDWYILKSRILREAGNNPGHYYFLEELE
jgi:hypothetical protein